MDTTRKAARHFRINPVELGIFSLVTIVFLNSVYNLFYDRHGFQPSALPAMTANPLTEGRVPAAVTPLFLNLGIKCEANSDQETTATKLRLNGPLCSAPGGEPAKLLKVQARNNANQANATIFMDMTSGQFSTDYIPLNSGKNPIHLEYVFQGGKVLVHDFNVVKN
jgi:hypothetical protein